jgi:hypothetical protein
MKPMTLTECLSSFYNRFPRLKADGKTRKKLADFVGASPDTTSKWMRGFAVPTGDYRSRTIIFFHMLGYQVVEYELWDEVLQKAAKVLAFNIAKPHAVSVAFGMSSYTKPLSSMNQVFSGALLLNAKRSESLAYYVKQKSQDIDLGEHKFRYEYADLMLPAMEHTAVKLEPAKVAEKSSPANVPALDTQVLVEVMAGLVTTMLPLAQFLESDSCSPQQRAQLRSLAQGNGVFKLANSLNRLCGERVRNESKGDS